MAASQECCDLDCLSQLPLEVEKGGQANEHVYLTSGSAHFASALPYLISNLTAHLRSTAIKQLQCRVLTAPHNQAYSTLTGSDPPETLKDRPWDPGLQSETHDASSLCTQPSSQQLPSLGVREPAADPHGLGAAFTSLLGV